MLTQPIVLPEDGRQSETAREVVRGTRRLLRARNIATVTELVLADGRRPDIVGMGLDGSITIVEVKSSIADFRADKKWHHYRAFCDHLYFAIPVTLPVAVMPDETGIIVTDGYGAEVVRDALPAKLAPATRRAMMIRFAQAAADRLHALAFLNVAAAFLVTAAAVSYTHLTLPTKA